MLSRRTTSPGAVRGTKTVRPSARLPIPSPPAAIERMATTSPLSTTFACRGDFRGVAGAESLTRAGCYGRQVGREISAQEECAAEFAVATCSEVVHVTRRLTPHRSRESGDPELVNSERGGDGVGRVIDSRREHQAHRLPVDRG